MTDPSRTEDNIRNKLRMTSTSFNVGLGDGSRASSRVLRPPGGGHTDIFGGEPEPPRTGRRMQPHPQPDEMSQHKPQNGVEKDSAGEPAPVVETAPAPAPSPVEEKPKLIQPEAPEPSKAEPPKRVRVPPGGFSSGLW